MKWTAIVPWKQGPDTKSRLRGVLDLTQRMALAAAMARHVIHRLAEVDAIGSVYLLAPTAAAGWPCQWLPDDRRGLNYGIATARHRLGRQRFVIVHADLPMLAKGDVECLLAAAEKAGAAFAPDRHGRGTNALALADSDPFEFVFGQDSFIRHRGQRIGAVVVENRGLGFDIDLPTDLQEAMAQNSACEQVLALQ